MKNLGQIELDPSKVLNEQERELNSAEREFYSLLKILPELVNKIDEARSELFRDVILPLEKKYKKEKNPDIRQFLSNVNYILQKYDNSTRIAGNQFAMAFGLKVYNEKYSDYFKNMRINYKPEISLLPLRPEQIKEIIKDMPYRISLSGFIPTPTGVITSLVLDKLLYVLSEIPVVQQAIGKIIEALTHAWREIHFILYPKERERHHKLTARANFLMKAIPKVENGLTVLFNAIQKTFGNEKKGELEIEIENLIRKLEAKERITVPIEVERKREVYVPYTILPEPLRKTITLPEGRAEVVEYKRVYKEKLAGYTYTDRAGKYFLLQYATGILIPKEEFPYAN